MINKCHVLELNGMNVNDHNLQFFSAVVLTSDEKGLIFSGPEWGFEL